MASGKKTKKKVVKTTDSRVASGRKGVKAKRANKSTATTLDFPLIFSKDNYIWMGIGAALIALGLMLMSGGGSDSIHEFDAEAIYSWRRITLAPFLILAGLVVEVYAIFKD